MKQVIYIFLLFVIIGCNNQSKKQVELKNEKVLTLPFFNSGDFTPEWIEKGSSSYKNIHKIPDFSFVNQEGNVVTQKDYLGKIYVADFFFTSCTGICRSLSLHMKLLQDKYMKNEEVLLLSHSVTPEMDSVPVLKKYANNYGVNSSKWNLVTGPKEEIYELARTAYFSDEDFVKTKEDQVVVEILLQLVQLLLKNGMELVG